MISSLLLLALLAPQERIAVMDVQVRSGVSRDVGQTLSDDLVTEVRKRRPQAIIIGASEIRSMLQMQGERQKLGCHTGTEMACLAEIGGALGAEEMITSTLGKVGKVYVFSLKLVDVPKAKVAREASQKLATKDEEDLLDAVGKLVAQLLPPQAAPVVPPPVVAAASVPPPAPAPMVEAPVVELPPVQHSRIPAILVGVAGLAAGGVAVFGLTQILHYNSEVSVINSQQKPMFTQSQLASDKSSATLWQPLSIGLAVVGAAGLTGAVILW